MPDIGILFDTDCKCNPDGSTTLQCDDKGECTCKEGFTGSKCDECVANVLGQNCDSCQANFFNYPTCQGKHKRAS